VLAQTKNTAKGSRYLCNRESAIDIIRQQLDSSKLIDDSVKRIAVLIRAADTIWPYKEESGRAALSEAFDLAEVNFKEKGDKPRREGLALSIETPDQRYVVIRAVAKRDAAWAKKMTDKMLEQEKREAEGNISRDSEGDAQTAAKLLASADSLLSSAPNAALTFARLSLRYPAGFQLPRFLYRLAETDQAAADQFYQEALTVYRDQPLSELLYLSPYPFGNRQAAGDMPVSASYPVPPTFKPNKLLEGLFIQTVLTRAQQAIAGKSDRTGFSGISDDGQIWLALTRLTPQIERDLGPELAATVDRVRNELFAVLTQDAQQAVTLSTSNQDPPKRAIDEEIATAEREPNSDKRDQLIATAVLRSADTQKLDKVLEYAEKISNSKLRQQVMNWIYFGRAQKLIKDKQFGEAKALATEVEELDQRAFLYAEIATQSLNRIETQSQAREMLDEILDVAEKAPNTIVTARTLLTVTYLYTKIDLGRSIAVMGDAIKSINRLDNPDFSQQFLFRKIEATNFARYASFQTPGLSPENVFRDLGKLDFDSAMLQASSLLDKSLRAFAMIAAADVCLQNTGREQKKDNVKKRTSL
jgi:hypothetical protein